MQVETSTTLLRDIAGAADNPRWGEFTARYRPLLEAFMSERFPGLEAEDLIQETFIAIARAMPEYRYAPDEKGHFRNFLTGILHHKALNALRSNRRRTELLRKYEAEPQAMRELSGRLEEIPGEEAFPAYLESRIAAFYERAGRVRLGDGSTGSVTIGGTVSPAGGNFDEPVTQATLKVVGGFHGLSRARSDARRYPAIDPLDSWSHYNSVIEQGRVERIRGILRRGNEVSQMMKVVGEEGTSLADFTVYLKAEFLDAVYLQQNAFSDNDATTPVSRQRVMFDVVEKALLAEYSFTEKDETRKFFMDLQQTFIDWNDKAADSPEFAALKAELEKKIASAYKSYG